MDVKNSIPRTRWARRLLGVLLILGGMVGFLPVVGYWMIPLGLYVLSIDSPRVRRFYRNWRVRIGRWWLSRNRRWKK